jgi:hypothetical protein
MGTCSVKPHPADVQVAEGCTPQYVLFFILLDEIDGAYNTHGKVKLSLCLIKHCILKAFGGVEVSTILDLSNRWR